MTKSLPAAFLVLLVLLQLPFTYVGVSIALGYASEGPAYFDGLQRSLSEAALPAEARVPASLSGAAVAGLGERVPSAADQF